MSSSDFIWDEPIFTTPRKGPAPQKGGSPLRRLARGAGLLLHRLRRRLRRTFRRGGGSLWGVVLFLTVACGTHDVQTPKKPVEVDQGFIRSETVTALGRVERYLLSPKALEERKRESAGAELVRLSVPSEFGVSVYRLNVPNKSALAAIVPKILFKSSLAGERLHFEPTAQGTVLSGSAALVDGLSPEIATGTGRRRVPRDFLIPNRDDFLGLVAKALGGPPKFMSSYSCPKEFLIRISGRAPLSVKFRGPLKFCPINTFFPVEIELTKNDWQNIREAFLEERAIEIEGVLDLSVPVTVEYATLKLNTAPLIAELKKGLVGKTPPISSAGLKKILEGFWERVRIAFGLSEDLGGQLQIFDFLAHSYFVEESVACADGIPRCYFPRETAISPAQEPVFYLGRDVFFGKRLEIALRAPLLDTLAEHQEFLLKAEPDGVLEPPKVGTINNILRSVREGEVIEFRINRFSMTHVSFDAPAIQTMPNRVCIAPFILCYEGRWTCTNQAIEKFNERTICVDSREECVRACINPVLTCAPVCFEDYFKKCYFPERKNLYKENTLKRYGCQCADLKEFVGGGQGFKACAVDQHCGGYVICRNRAAICYAHKTIYDERRLCDRLPSPPLPVLPYRTNVTAPTAPDFRWDCAKLSQNQCDADKWQDQWQRITTYSYPFAGTGSVDRPLELSIAQILVDGIDAKLTYRSGTGPKEVVCPLAALDHKIVPPNRLVIAFENTAACAPYNDDNRRPGFAPNLTLVNRMVLASQFQCGTLWENWQGKRKYTCRLPSGEALERETTVAEDEALIKNKKPIGIHIPFYPRIRVQGTLRVVGGYFESTGGKTNE